MVSDSFESDMFSYHIAFCLHKSNGDYSMISIPLVIQYEMNTVPYMGVGGCFGVPMALGIFGGAGGWWFLVVLKAG